jgi:hypothetical protein
VVAKVVLLSEVVGVGPDTVPVKVGDANGARFVASRFSAACVAVEMGLLVSEVLFTFPKPTIAAVIPLTVPVKVGLLMGASVAKAIDRPL